MTVNDRNKPNYDTIIEMVTLVKNLRHIYESIGFHHIHIKKMTDNLDRPISRETQIHNVLASS